MSAMPCRLLAALLCFHPACAQVRIFRSIFSAEECARIVQLFGGMPAERDVRSNPLLPQMPGSGFTVERINRFDTDDELLRAGELGWIHQRIIDAAGSTLAPLLPAEGACTASASRFGACVDFHLLHEFAPPTGHFDWHVDSKPGDGRDRTWNINVMLSSPSAYEGGELRVGSQRIEADIGDTYMYSSATPHAVSAVTSGRRFTFVLALTERKVYHLSAEAAGFPPSDASIALARIGVERQRVWWEQQDVEMEGLTRGALSGVPKVHILHGEMLEASGRVGEAQQAFCNSYRASPDASRYVDAFLPLGVQALQGQAAQAAQPGQAGQAEQAEARPDLDLAESYFRMASCIDPTHTDAAEALSVVRDAIARAQQEVSDAAKAKERLMRQARLRLIADEEAAREALERDSLTVLEPDGEATNVWTP